jgi:cytochrome c551/c552
MKALKTLLIGMAAAGSLFAANVVWAGDAAEVEKKIDAIMEEGGYICKTCHQFDTKTIGPAYMDVAKHYKDADDAAVATLVKQVVEGKSENLIWGPDSKDGKPDGKGTMPMPPNMSSKTSQPISEEHAKELVKLILSLAK